MSVNFTLSFLALEYSEDRRILAGDGWYLHINRGGFDKEMHSNCIRFGLPASYIIRLVIHETLIDLQ